MYLYLSLVFIAGAIHHLLFYKSFEGAIFLVLLAIYILMFHNNHKEEREKINGLYSQEIAEARKKNI